MIGRTIHEELPVYEPRINIHNVNVIAKPDDNQYQIDISIIIPSLDNRSATSTGILTDEGFNYI